MNLKKIIIYQHKILFNILYEIKEKLNYDLIEADKDNFGHIIKDLKTDFLIISKKEKDNFKNQIIFDETPMKLTKLVELINLKLLKDKFSYQSDITVGQYKLNINSREISEGDKIINLTEREINLILFLKQAVKPVKIDELQKKVWEYGSELETHTVETHIYRLRKKIKDSFNDENFIKSSKEGYSIN